MITTLGWVGTILLGVGLYLIGYKWRHAFLFSIAGEALWLVKSLALGQYDLAVCTIMFLALALKNWFQWREPTKYLVMTGSPYPDPSSAHVIHNAPWVKEGMTLEEANARDRAANARNKVTAESEKLKVGFKKDGFVVTGQDKVNKHNLFKTYWKADA